MDLTERLMAYESGDMPDEEVPQLFQELVDTGMAWSLQGHYGRMADKLIREGKIRPKGASNEQTNKRGGTGEVSEAAPTPTVGD